jgi:hypothetical protein
MTLTFIHQCSRPYQTIIISIILLLPPPPPPPPPLLPPESPPVCVTIALFPQSQCDEKASLDVSNPRPADRLLRRH